MAGELERFAVGGVAACDRGEPEAASHLIAGDVAPAAVQVVLVLDLVEDDGLVPGGEPGGGAVEVDGLDGGMGDPGAGVIVGSVGVVNGAEMSVPVVLFDDVEEAIEVLGGLGAHEVVLVGEGPPEVGEGGEAGKEVNGGSGRRPRGAWRRNPSGRRGGRG